MPTAAVPSSPELSHQIRLGMATAGAVFIAIGLAALVVPQISTIVVEQVVAWLLVVWGGMGIAFAASFRDVSGWIAMAAGFVLVLLAGVAFLLFPVAGAEIMTAVLVVVFLLEGALQILVGLRTGSQMRRSGWLIASGAASFVLGAVLLIQWPVASAWVIGFLTGLNFLTTGLALMVAARRVRSGTVQ